jgi:hypothetical protein
MIRPNGSVNAMPRKKEIVGKFAADRIACPESYICPTIPDGVIRPDFSFRQCVVTANVERAIKDEPSQDAF